MLKRLFLISALTLALFPFGARVFADDAYRSLPAIANNTHTLRAEIKMVKEENPNLEAHPSITIDEQHRMIGCIHSLSGKQETVLPAQKFHFSAQQGLVSASPVIIIDRIFGMNTPEAHVAGQSEAKYVSSPTVVKVNGQRVGYIYTDTEDYHLPIPNGVLSQGGFNTIELEAGFFFLPGDVLSYDEIHFQNVSVQF